MWAHVSHFGGRICGELGGAYAFAANFAFTALFIHQMVRIFSFLMGRKATFDDDDDTNVVVTV